MVLSVLPVVSRPIEEKKPPAFAVAPISYHEYQFELVHKRLVVRSALDRGFVLIANYFRPKFVIIIKPLIILKKQR